MSKSRRCDDCRQSFERVPHAPMLLTASWAKLAKPDENLCVDCFFERAIKRRVVLTLTDLKPCPFNRFGKPSFFDLFTQGERPEVISDWLKWLDEGQRAMEERQKVLVEKYRRYA